MAELGIKLLGNEDYAYEIQRVVWGGGVSVGEKGLTDGGGEG